MDIKLNPSHIIGTIIGAVVGYFVIALITKDLVVEWNDQATGRRGARVQKQVLGYNLPSL